MDIRLKWVGLQKTINRYNSERRQKKAFTVFKLMVKKTARRLKRNTPRNTGALAASTDFESARVRYGFVGRIYQDARNERDQAYGHFVREGTDPHIIQPRKKKALFFTLEGGEPVFARLVQHPGTKANPYDDKTLSETARLRKSAAHRILRLWSRD